MNKKLKIVVIGGSGLIGSKVVNHLREEGHEVIAASPSTGVNTITGEGLAEALKGAHVVVDVANSPNWEDKAVLEFFETSSRNLLSAEAAAGVRHHVALSVVGTERLLASGYFRAKMAQRYGEGSDLIKMKKRFCAGRAERRGNATFPCGGHLQSSAKSWTFPDEVSRRFSP